MATNWRPAFYWAISVSSRCVQFKSHAVQANSPTHALGRVIEAVCAGISFLRAYIKTAGQIVGASQ